MAFATYLFYGIAGAALCAIAVAVLEPYGLANPGSLLASLGNVFSIGVYACPLVFWTGALVERFDVAAGPRGHARSAESTSRRPE